MLLPCDWSEPVSPGGQIAWTIRTFGKSYARPSTNFAARDCLKTKQTNIGHDCSRGFRWILVDEYQDVGPDEYALISALAGRTLPDEDDKLSLFAVGDDDQNIYGFKGSSVEYIRRFESDYRAKPVFLTDNYRSTGHIIDAANNLIEGCRQRMKVGHPIHIDRSREKEAPGGPWAKVDPVARGQVQILAVGDNSVSQAQVVVAELKRMSELAPAWDWSTCAVVARQWRYLDPVRSLCRLEGIPVQMANEEFTGIWRLRETQALLRWLRGVGLPLVKIGDLTNWVGNQPSGPWTRLLGQAVEEYELEAGSMETPGEPLHRVAGRVGTRRPSPATRSSTTDRPPCQGPGVRPPGGAGRKLG